MPAKNSPTARNAGQRLMVGFDGKVFNDQLKFYLQELNVGGLMLFGRNLESADQIEDLCGSAQAYAKSCGSPPLFIGIDQEGGVVARLKPPFTQFPGNPAMRTLEDAMTFARITARELTQIGVNVDMAPVLDVLPREGASVMRDRSFGPDPHKAAEMGATIIDHLQRNGVMAVAKHFPGIGRTILDSHEDLPDLDIDAHSLAAVDLIPFQAAIAQGVGGVMLSHIRYTRIDPRWPASLSPAIASDLLRREMGFDGLVLTDDLDMGAIAKHHDVPAIVAQCLTAGIDILLICHAGPNIEHAFHQIQHSTDNSKEMADKMRRSLDRIHKAKQRFLV